MAAKEMQFPWRWTSGTISPNLDFIWGMSGEELALLVEGVVGRRMDGEEALRPGDQGKGPRTVATSLGCGRAYSGM